MSTAINQRSPNESLAHYDEMIRFHLRELGISLSFATKEIVISAYRSGITSYRAATEIAEALYA
jgi:hypothetical protein